MSSEENAIVVIALATSLGGYKKKPKNVNEELRQKSGNNLLLFSVLFNDLSVKNYILS